MVKIMAFVIMCNIAAYVFDVASMGKWTTDMNSGTHQYDLNEMKKNVTGFPADNSGSSFFLIRIFDYITLGFLKRYLDWINGVLYGFPTLLAKAGFLGPGAGYSWLLQLIDTGLTFCYVIASIELFTGRNLTDV